MAPSIISCLQWFKTVGDPFNQDSLDIQKSTDGINWLNIGQTPAAGNSNMPLSYQYTDTTKQENNLYYRLNLVNKDNTSIYSKMITIELTPALHTISISPNPFTDQLNILCTVPTGGPAEVLLQDITGNTLIHKKYTAMQGTNTFTLSQLNSLPQAVYILRIICQQYSLTSPVYHRKN